SSPIRHSDLKSEYTGRGFETDVEASVGWHLSAAERSRCLNRLGFLLELDSASRVSNFRGNTVGHFAVGADGNAIDVEADSVAIPGQYLIVGTNRSEGTMCGSHV